MNDIKIIMTQKVQSMIDFELEGTVQSPIFVFIGVEPYVNIEAFDEFLVDKDTFTKNGNHEVFNQMWFTKVFMALQTPEKKYHILSFPQYSYLIYHLNIDFFANRIVIIRDTLRMLLPITKEDFLTYNTSLMTEERRPDNMPDYMAEQISIGGNFYYSINAPLDNFATVSIFDDKAPLQKQRTNKAYELVDIVNDPHCLDIFLNQCLLEQNFKKKVLVRVHEKHPQDNSIKLMLEQFNGLLQLFGGEVFEFVDHIDKAEDFTPSKETLSLLRKYWGENAEFRSLKVYKNPDYEKTVVSISQGLIVETIINEYKNARKGKSAKDLFLTAPTGAGKSLLFQLPAFYVSSQYEITIVISPLIALMKDQVAQIRNERNYQKVQFLNGELSLIDRDRVIEECKKGEIDILYMAPELLLSYDISFFIGERKLGLMVIDEAHLITTWGRDFRVDYWFLGQHINKMRKYLNYSFPMVAVTATAIYGGDNDMVFDSINSLYMNDPHTFVGEVKRNDIRFVIDNHDKYKSNYDSEKEKETVQFIENIHKLGVKTIIYTPYTSHIGKIQQRLEADQCGDIAVSYYGSLAADAKEYAYNRFRTNETKVMICTKAFGMGVDIPNIELVYHHAPSGLLPDYIQEIGRAARSSSIQGFAALSYAREDQRYSRALHGMSSLKLYQLKEVIKKIYKTFLNNGKKRNMLISVDDFGYIFENVSDLDQKIMTALMMIEKDYLSKFRFNVLIARPKKLFVKVYARTNYVGYQTLLRLYPSFFEVINIHSDYYTLKLNLDNIWQSNFSDQSFPIIKRNFYNGNLFKDDNIELTPLVKVTFTLTSEEQIIRNKLIELFNALRSCFVALQGSYFEASDLDEKFKEESSYDKEYRKKIINFVLSTYSDRSSSDETGFLQRRRGMNQRNQYQVLNNSYNSNFANLQRSFSDMVNHTSGNEIDRYVSVNSGMLTNYVRLGSLLEIMELAIFESRGGDKPMLFVRINDPLRIRRDAESPQYSNRLLSKTTHRHETSSALFDHFFLHSFKDEDRWNFIEDYFLGMSNDELLQKYPGGTPNHIDVIKYIERSVQHIENTDSTITANYTQLNIYPPRSDEWYGRDRLLSIDNRTLRVGQWITEDPVALDKIIIENRIRLQEDYKVLQSHLRHEHFEYYRDKLGLKLKIDMPKFEPSTPAIIPYTNAPIEFYKWWKRNEGKVTMTHFERIKLFIKVDELKPGTLLKRHKKEISNE